MARGAGHTWEKRINGLIWENSVYTEEGFYYLTAWP